MLIRFSKIFFFFPHRSLYKYGSIISLLRTKLSSSISIQKLQLSCWCFTFQRKTTSGVVLSQRGSHHPGYWPRQRSHTLHHFCDSLPLLSAEGTVFPAGFSLWASSVDAHLQLELAFSRAATARQRCPGTATDPLRSQMWRQRKKSAVFEWYKCLICLLYLTRPCWCCWERGLQSSENIVVVCSHRFTVSRDRQK